MTDLNPLNANENSLRDRDVSDWMSDDDESPNAIRLENSANEQSPSETPNHVSRRVYGWTFVLIVVAILGNLAVPFTLDVLILGERYTPPPNAFPDGSVLEWMSYYSATALRSVFFGVWFAEYVAVWLWINSFVASRTTRWLLGLFLSAAVSYSVVLGMSIAWGPAPTDFFWFCMIGSLGLYATINVLLKLLLRRSDFRWQPVQLGSGSRYSIRALLGTMVGSAMLMLGLKLFPYDPARAGDSTVFLFAILAIWLAWLAMAIPTLIWLELGAVFSRRRGRFFIGFVALAAFGPSVFHLIGAWILAWNSATEFAIQFEQFVIAYSIEVGLIAGVALILPLLPRRVQGKGQGA